MKYVSNSNDATLLKEADDKFFEILSSLLKSKIYFYDKEATEKSIISIDNEVKGLEELVQSLPTKSTDELLNLAKEYGVSFSDAATPDFIVPQLQDKIYSKIDSLRVECNRLSSDFDNYQRTYIYTMESHIQSIKNAPKTYDIDLLEKYEFLSEKFQSLIDKLKILSKWILALAPDMAKLEDIKETRDNLIYDLKNEYKKVADISSSNLPSGEVINVDNNTGEMLSALYDLNQKYNESKAKVFSIIDENQVQINFKDLKEEIFEDLLYIKSNMAEASQNGVLSITESDLDKYMDAFYTLFFYPIINEGEFRSFLALNGFTIENEYKKSFKELIEENQKEEEPVNVETQLPYENENVRNDRQVVQTAVSENTLSDEKNIDQTKDATVEKDPGYSSLDNHSSIDYAAGVEVQADTVWEPVGPQLSSATNDDNKKDEQAEINSTSVQSAEIQPEEPTENAKEPVENNEESIPVSNEPKDQNVSGGQIVFNVVSSTQTSDGDLANAKAKAKGIISEKESAGVRVRGGNL